MEAGTDDRVHCPYGRSGSTLGPHGEPLRPNASREALRVLGLRLIET
jgi:hypothetical protein